LIFTGFLDPTIILIDCDILNSSYLKSAVYVS
jgi:hypothetical protein